VSTRFLSREREQIVGPGGSLSARRRQRCLPAERNYAGRTVPRRRRGGLSACLAAASGRARPTRSAPPIYLASGVDDSRAVAAAARTDLNRQRTVEQLN